MAYVISKDGEPLMPCSPAIARLLLKSGKAKCVNLPRLALRLEAGASVSSLGADLSSCR